MIFSSEGTASSDAGAAGVSPIPSHVHAHTKAAPGAPAPLATVPEGRCVRLTSIHGGHGLRARLASMGLSPGSEMTVLRNSGRGPFLLAVRHARIAIGRNMANKILVS